MTAYRLDGWSRDLTQFTMEERAAGYWRFVFSNPPTNLLNSVTVVELAEIVRQIEAAPNLRVVVFASAHPEFFMARYDLSDSNPVAFAPTESGVTVFIDSMSRLNAAAPITIASIQGGLEVAAASSRSHATFASRASRRRSSGNPRSPSASCPPAEPSNG